MCLCTLLSALVRNFQAGFSVVMTLQPDPRCRSPARQGDLPYPAESLGRCLKIWDSHLCHWPFAATEPAPGMQLCKAAVGCIPAGRCLAGGSVERRYKTALGHLEPVPLSGHIHREEAGRFSRGGHILGPLSRLLHIQGHLPKAVKAKKQSLMPLHVYNPNEL